MCLRLFFFFCCGIERGVDYHFFIQIKVENYGIVKTLLNFSVYIKIISINTGGQTYQVLPFDAFLLPQPVEAAVRDANERWATGHTGFPPHCTSWSGPWRRVRKFPEKSLVLAIYGSDLIIGEWIVLPVSPSRIAEDQFSSKLTFWAQRTW